MIPAPCMPPHFLYGAQLSLNWLCCFLVYCLHVRAGICLIPRTVPARGSVNSVWVSIAERTLYGVSREQKASKDIFPPSRESCWSYFDPLGQKGNHPVRCHHFPFIALYLLCTQCLELLGPEILNSQSLLCSLRVPALFCLHLPISASNKKCWLISSRCYAQS